MSVLVLQVFLLIVIAYIVGCITGCLLHQFFAEDAPLVLSDDDAALMSATEPAIVASPLPTAPAPVLKTEPPKVQVPVSKDPQLPDLQLPRAPRLDDLKRIRGIGRQNEIRLNSIGVTSYSQIAGWSTARQAEIGARLSFPGRIEREDWVGQAKILARGEQTAFSRSVDSGEVPTSDEERETETVGKKPKTLKAPRNRKPDDLTRITGIGNGGRGKPGVGWHLSPQPDRSVVRRRGGLGWT